MMPAVSRPYQACRARTGAGGLAAALLVCGTGDPAHGAQEAAASAGELALAIVTDQLGLDPTAGRVIDIEAIVFADSSLECPQPGMAYSQVLTPGHRVLIEVEGRRFDVRVAGTGARICAGRHREPTAREPPTPAAGDLAAMAEAARSDLARRLGLQATAVLLLETRSVRPGEIAPGCAAPAGGPESGPAYLIRLEADNRRYDVVSDGAGIRYCPELRER